MTGPYEGLDGSTRVIQDLDADIVIRYGLQIVVDGSAVRRIVSGVAVVREIHCCFQPLETISRSGSEKVDVGIENLRCELLQGCNIIQDPEAATVSPHHQVVEVILKGEIVHRRMRKVVL
jgi:hypothetical protein